MYNMFENDSDDEEEDEWFYNSMFRYKQLQMFGFENTVHHIEPSCHDRICVAQRHKPDKYEILELSLPEKLLTESHQDCLMKSSDFKVKNGGFIDFKIVQMKVLYDKKILIVSEENASELAVYRLGSENSDLVKKQSHIPTSVESPSLAVNDSNDILASSIGSKNVELINTETAQVITSSPLGSEDGRTKPIFVSRNVGGVCSVDSGAVRLKDLRSNSNWSLVCKEFSQRSLIVTNPTDEEYWTVASTYENYFIKQPSESNSKLGLLSTQGRLLLYDMRNTNSAFCDKQLEKRTQHCDEICLRFSPDSLLRLSVTGFDENVYVYEIDLPDNLKTVFTHDGHSKQKSSVGNTSVISHLWWRDNLVISAATNNSLHCWRF
uniref:Uncharacterized protein n=1 Tax=Timema douglasi TaxID=61478 RepID=A0A7R8VPR9_TIMDO|nr:unnamed protein product [Timema douglasi]